MESGLLAGIKSEPLAPQVVEEVRRYVRQSLQAKREHSSDPLQRLRKLEEEVSNLVDTIGRGALRASPATADRLVRAEDELARPQSAARPQKVTEMEWRFPRVTDRYRAIVQRIETSLPEGDFEEARVTLREVFGSIRVIAEEQEVWFEADLRETQTAPLRAAGGSANNVVAGAGLWACLLEGTACRRREARTDVSPLNPPRNSRHGAKPALSWLKPTRGAGS